MCGIFGIINSVAIPETTIRACFEKGRNRGPESSSLSQVNIKATFGFHRLAINGLNPTSDQPIRIKDISLICNGEIYNYRELYALMEITPETDSDCEVIIHLYLRYGIAQTVQMLDGVFAFALMDNRIHLEESRMYLARDPYGVRPLYYGRFESMPVVVAFASEAKSLISLDTNIRIEHFAPGHFAEYLLRFRVNPEWYANAIVPYHRPVFSRTGWNPITYDDIYRSIQQHFVAAVEKRCVTTERPIACLLSGGLDSSLVTALVQRHHSMRGLLPVETYSIGLADSEDLKWARIVADHLGTEHTEIILTEADFLRAIPEVIHAIESYDTTTVRASIGNYLIGKYIVKHSEAKVIFNGDGSDELLGGYLYMHACPDAIEYDRECRRLLYDIHLFDVLRSDKSISSHGLEPRTPFLDRGWAQMYLSLPPAIRYTTWKRGTCEKELLRMAFSPMHWKEDERPLLPQEILWRKKEAFSDGVSNKGRSLYQIIQDFTNTVVTDEVFEKCAWKHNKPATKEQYYYRSVFEMLYPGQGHLVPYFWMPKYVEATDASARTLDLYDDDSDDDSDEN
jgi:asparagine synthase (glutamine-hydrolysing)